MEVFTMSKLYPGKAFSPPAILVDNIGGADTIIKVSDISVFPDAPNYATIGSDENGETIIYTAKTTDSLSGCQRGVEGAAKAWAAGELIARNFTAADHADVIAAIKKNSVAVGTAQTTAETARDMAQAAKEAADAAQRTADTATAGVTSLNKEKGKAGGLATLDTNGIVPASQRSIKDDADATTKYILGIENGKLYIMEVV